METTYEVLNKETGVWTPATFTIAGEVDGDNINDAVFTLETGEQVIFKNEGAIGDLDNDTHAVRIMETEGQADGTGFVTDEGVETEVAPEAEQ